MDKLFENGHFKMSKMRNMEQNVPKKPDCD